MGDCPALSLPSSAFFEDRPVRDVARDGLSPFYDVIVDGPEVDLLEDILCQNMHQTSHSNNDSDTTESTQRQETFTMMKNPVVQKKVGSSYASAANSLLGTINFNLEDIRNWAILDSGATSHFLVPEASTINIQLALHPLPVIMPDGNSVASTHACKLNLPQLPSKARLGHII